jgi:hypothetical protein
MAIPRRVLVIAGSALATAGVLYVRNRMQESKRAAEEQARAQARASARGDRPTTEATTPSSTSGAPASSTTSSPAEPSLPGAARELSQFLAGETWFDETGWQDIWRREGIEAPPSWLRMTGRDVLLGERKKLSDHPALLAGCRRRWIVVCRYAGIDVGDAASLWDQSDAPSA